MSMEGDRKARDLYDKVEIPEDEITRLTRILGRWNPEELLTRHKEIKWTDGETSLATFVSQDANHLEHRLVFVYKDWEVDLKHPKKVKIKDFLSFVGIGILHNRNKDDDSFWVYVSSNASPESSLVDAIRLTDLAAQYTDVQNLISNGLDTDFQTRLERGSIPKTLRDHGLVNIDNHLRQLSTAARLGVPTLPFSR